MIPIKKTSPEKVKEFCEDIYSKITQNSRQELDDIIYNNFNSVLYFKTKEKAFLTLMMLEYGELKNIKNFLENFSENKLKKTEKVILSYKDFLQLLQNT